MLRGPRPARAGTSPTSEPPRTTPAIVFSPREKECLNEATDPFLARQFWDAIWASWKHVNQPIGEAGGAGQSLLGEPG